MTPRARSALRVLGAILAALGYAALVWHERRAHAAVLARLYLGEQIVVYAALAVWFGASLGARREALCTVWAARLHGPLDPRTRRYTRTVTLAWAFLFGMIAVALGALLLVSPARVFPAAAGLGAFVAIVAMFVAEYRIRLRVLPHLPHVGILAGVRAYLASTRGSTPGHGAA